MNKTINTANYTLQRDHRLSHVIPLLCCLGLFMIFPAILCGCGSEEMLIPVEMDTREGDDAGKNGDAAFTFDEGYNAAYIADGENPYSSVNVENAYSSANAEGEVKEISLSEANKARNTCCVFVCGCVVNPDVYELDCDKRLIDAIKAAGGFSENANENYINLALKVADGMKIYVPAMDENIDELKAKGLIDSSLIADASENPSGQAVSGETRALVNINTADEAGLMTLPGIGQSKASKIIAFREKNGAFSQISDIMKVEGIKNGMYDKIKEYITVD